MVVYLRGLWRACRAIRRIHRQKPVDAILLWFAEGPANLLVFKVLAKSLGAVLVAEECEFPFNYYKRTAAVSMKMWFNDHVGYRLLDGVIAISTFLEDYFSVRLGKKAGLLRVPILIETDRFASTAEHRDGEDKRIIYLGTLAHDGEVAGLLRAFSLVAGEFPQWSVQVIGDLSDEKQAAELKGLVAELGLDGRVQFTGHCSRRDIPSVLSQGDVMALPRAAGTFSQAGFPTKLGEYLASGKPVVVTSTGDIPQYLQDGVNAFLTPPGDTDAFAERLRYVMSHPEEAAEVGRRGREVAVKNFDTLANCGRVVEFIRELRTARFC